MNTKPKLAACVLVINTENNTILSVSRKDNPTQSGLPGGKVDPGETFIEAAAREFKEETGYEIEPGDLIPVFKMYTENDGYTTETFMLPFKFFNPINQKTLEAHETGAVRWVNWQTLFDGPFGNYNRELYLALSKSGILLERQENVGNKFKNGKN